MKDKIINLRSNYPSLESESELFNHFVLHHLDKQKLLQQPALLSSEKWFEMLSPQLAIPASALNKSSRVETCCSGNQALFAVLFACRSLHTVIGVETYTYNNCIALANLLGYKLLPLDCDEEGIQTMALKAAIGAGCTLFYVQPTIQNPTCSVMSIERRKEIAVIITNSNAMLIEDDAYRFLHPQPPASFLELIPEKTIHIYSLSKPFNSFIKTCFIILPKQALPQLSKFIYKSGTSLSSLSFLFSQYLLQLTDFKALILQKKENAKQIQQFVKPVLESLIYKTFFTSFHVWIKLPESINSKSLADEFKNQNILITGSQEYSPTGDTGFIRVALSGEKDRNVLQSALREISYLLLQ